MSGTTDQRTVAVLGCGLMGSAVARALARAGHDVVVWNRTPQKAQALVGERVSAAASPLEAVAAASVVVSVLSDHGALREALGEDPPLQGRTLVDLTTGTPAQAADMGARVRRAGGRHLDGVIGAFPEEIGEAGCVVSCAGDGEVYRSVEPVLRALGGGIRHVGADVGAAAVLDTAMVGMFFIPALVAFADSVGYLRDRGVDIAVVASGLERDLAILHHQMRDLLSAVARGSHETDQATVDTYGQSTALFLQEVGAAGSRGQLLAAAHGVLQRVRDSGRGSRGMSAVTVRQAADLESGRSG
jgi:3-hydroxyisobutyrate dehydrogenase-like beta-hydroxyacid dehydrogenase